LLDQLDEELAAGRKMPLGGGAVVDRKRFADLINELRLAIPANVRQARGILERGEQTLDEAREEAARIIAAADREAGERVAEAEINRRAHEEARQIEERSRAAADRMLREAEERASALVARAEQDARQQRAEADAYAVALLTQLQRTLGAFLGNVRESLKAFPEHEEE
jgi:hypothetical protein